MAFIKKQKRAVICLSILLTAYCNAYSADTTEYIDRDGTRFEGLIEVGTASLDLLLTSFVAYRERGSLDSGDQLNAARSDGGVSNEVSEK